LRSSAVRLAYLYILFVANITMKCIREFITNKIITD